MVCIFSPVTTTRGNEIIRPEPQFNTYDQFLIRFPLLLIKDGQAGYETNPIDTPPPIQQQLQQTNTEPSINLESKLFELYFDHVHPAYPVLLKQSIMNIHSQDRLLLSRGLRYAIMALGSHYFPSHSLPSFYSTARQEASALTPRLDSVQTLLLLYKHDEIHTSSGHGIYFLERAQKMIGQIQSLVPQHQEMINRARWILFGSIGFSNLSDPNFNKLYTMIELPLELPQALAEELDENVTCSAHLYVNRFAQIANLSVLYSHTVQSMITNSTCHLICLKQFKEIRQHWHDSQHPIIQSRLVSLCPTDEEEIDIMILYSAVLYDMLYLLLLSHYHLEAEWDRIKTAYRLQRMVHTLVMRSSFSSAIQSRRMCCFALMLCLQTNISRDDDKVDCEFIEQIRQSMQYIKLDARIGKELSDLYTMVNNQNKILTPQIQQQQQQQDYFSLAPQQFNSTTNSSPVDNLANTPGLWSTTTNGGLTTPIREDLGSNSQVTSEWILEQQRQHDQQFQTYQLQQLPQYQTIIPSYNNYSSSSNNTPLTTTPSYMNTNEDYFYLNPGHWSPSIEQLNQSTNYLKIHNNDQRHNTFTLHPPPPPPPTN